MKDDLLSNRIAACTIISRNYAAYAKTLADSLKKSNPTVDFYVLLVDTFDASFEKEAGLENILWVESLDILQFRKKAFQFDILELNTNVKPFLLKRLLNDYAMVFYFDPDIYIFGSLNGLVERLRLSTAIITPHITSPIEDDKKPSEIDFLKAGSYNLGFIGVSACEESIKLLDWWGRRCIEIGFNDPRQGLFVDQRFIDLAPSLFEGISIERSVVYNVAYWNLHERLISFDDKTGLPKVNNLDLVFFHFSGISIDPPTEPRLEVSKYQDRSNFSNRPDVKPLFDAYRSQLASNNHRNFKNIAYGFSCFSNGELINAMSRRVFSMMASELDQQVDPFDANGLVYKKLKKLGLLEVYSPKAHNSFSMNENAFSLKIMQFALRITFRVLRPKRYSMLMAYLGYIASVRNQKEILLRKSAP